MASYRVTYTENEQGAKGIDVSELERAYMIVRSMDDLKLSEVVNDSQGPSSASSDLKELAKTVELVRRLNNHLNKKLTAQENRTFWEWLIGAGG